MLNADLSLSSYPAKIRRPVQALRSAGCIDDQLVTTVLLGAPRDDQRHLFLYHLLLVRGLRDTNIAVDDTVVMAAAADRLVDFHWSARRWKDEHNRLSRWATLQQLAAASRVYDLAAYREHLPDTWPGYLIPNGHRLGMEGLRQRHCVASYDARIALGQCAIAVVFVQRRRWTVQLFLTHDPLQPVYVSQVRGFMNRVPSPPERDAVIAALDMPPNWQSSHNALLTTLQHEGNSRQESLDVLEAALPVLRATGVARVEVAFDGSGDSGMIEQPSFHDREGSPVSVSELTCPVLAGDVWEDLPLEDVLERAIERYLDSTGVDWYNNEGGYGEFTLDVASGCFESSIDCRYTSSESMFYEEYELGTEAQDAA